LALGASAGIATTERMPVSREARATGLGNDLPEETGYHAALFFSLGERKILLVAPRILKAPARCKFSHLKKTSHPATWLKDREVMMGVR